MSSGLALCVDINTTLLIFNNKGIYCDCQSETQVPNQKNIYGAALALIAIMYGSMQGIVAVASILATMALCGNCRDPHAVMYVWDS